MNRPQIKRALISVYDKTGIVDFARALVNEFGVEIISTGGTATLLRKEGIPVTLVEEVTGFPELMDGRVKTLHPKIHAGILADRDNPEHMRQLEQHGIKPIDMVVVNLYPFEKTVADPNCTFEQAIEMIDIGGPCMLRAAAKNHRHVLVVVDPDIYDDELFELRSEYDEKEDLRNRRLSAAWVFGRTHQYERAIEAYLDQHLLPGAKDEELQKYFARSRKEWDNENHTESGLPIVADWDATLSSVLRYGENPHQVAGLYEPISGEWEGGIDQIDLAKSVAVRGEMSFNNYVDADAAIILCRELALNHSGKSATVIIKHTNSCGVGLAADPFDAYRQAYLGDPTSAFGGVCAFSVTISREIASSVMDTLDLWGKSAGQSAFFLEVWIAPFFEADALMVIKSRKPWGSRVRILPIQNMLTPECGKELDFRKITGAMLVQSRDTAALNEDQWKVVTKRTPTVSEISDLRLAWLIAKHTKSNAISICKDGMLIGNGAGQMSRVMSCRIATWLAKENGHEAKLAGSVAASDAFFPFADGPKILLDAGVTALIQPGGSKRDEDTIKLCDERGAAMIFTGTRHFRH